MFQDGIQTLNSAFSGCHTADDRPRLCIQINLALLVFMGSFNSSVITGKPMIPFTIPTGFVHFFDHSVVNLFIFFDSLRISVQIGEHLNHVLQDNTQLFGHHHTLTFPLFATFIQVIIPIAMTHQRDISWAAMAPHLFNRFVTMLQNRPFFFTRRGFCRCDIIVNSLERSDSCCPLRAIGIFFDLIQEGKVARFIQIILNSQWKPEGIVRVPGFDPIILNPIVIVKCRAITKHLSGDFLEDSFCRWSIEHDIGQ